MNICVYLRYRCRTRAEEGCVRTSFYSSSKLSCLHQSKYVNTWMEASHLSKVNIAENKNTSKSVISSYVNFAGTFTLRLTKNRLGFTTYHRKLTKNTEYNFLAQLPLVLNQETWQLHGQLPPRKAN